MQCDATNRLFALNVLLDAARNVPRIGSQTSLSRQCCVTLDRSPHRCNTVSMSEDRCTKEAFQKPNTFAALGISGGFVSSETCQQAE